MVTEDSYSLVESYRAGDCGAAEAIFDRYVERLLALAQSRLSVSLRRRVDPDDVVQSAFRSFFVHAGDDAYVLRQSGDLWRLLAQITLHKLYGQAERHQAKRRSVAREVAVDGASVDKAVLEPAPVEVVALVEQLHLFSQHLSNDQRQVLTRHLQGDELDVIAEAVHKSPRTVRRLLAEVRGRLELELAHDGAAHDVRRAALRLEIDQRATLKAGDYILERMIGAGAMGKVYLARDRNSGRNLAVKSLRKLHQGDCRAVELFLQEAEILTKLRHPHLVVVHGLGQFPGGGLFIVMDYVSGTNLQERLRNGPLGVRKAVEIVDKVASALAHAHKNGVVHADLKPGNVLLDAAERPVVTDFGFARIMAANASARNTSIGGTAGYMAPEVQRLFQQPTIAADVFGLGALLWTLCSGSAPNAEAMPEDLVGELAVIEPVCRRCLAPRPADRYRRVTDLQFDLAELLTRV